MPWTPLLVSPMCVLHPMETAMGKTCSLLTTRHRCRCCGNTFTLSPDDVSLHAAVEGDDVGLHPRVKNANLFQRNFFHQVAQVGIVELHARLASYGVTAWVSCVVECLRVIHAKQETKCESSRFACDIHPKTKKHTELRRVLLYCVII